MKPTTFGKALLLFAAAMFLIGCNQNSPPAPGPATVVPVPGPTVVVPEPTPGPPGPPGPTGPAGEPGTPGAPTP